MMKKTLALLICMLLLFSIIPLTAGVAEGATPKVGSYIKYGRYPQTASGKDKTPIEWLVLAVDKENNKALLLSRYGLDAKPYNTKDVPITWAKSTIRSWLNGYGAGANKSGIDYSKSNFINTAFTAAEKKWIYKTKVDNSNKQHYNRGYDTSGPDTKDYVFLLSYVQAHKYLGVNWWDKDDEKGYPNKKSRTHPTDFAVKRGTEIYDGYKTMDGKSAGQWWLRSSDYIFSFVTAVYPHGGLGFEIMSQTNRCVRPAFWINLNSPYIK